MQKVNIDGIKYTTKEVNATFKIWVYGKDENGKKVDTIIGVPGLVCSGLILQIRFWIGRLIQQTGINVFANCDEVLK